MTITIARSKLLENLINRPIRIDGCITNLNKYIESLEEINVSIIDGMIDYNRISFNRMNYNQQKAYIERLKNKRYYIVGGITVPKTVYDWVVSEKQHTVEKNSLLE